MYYPAHWEPPLNGVCALSRACLSSDRNHRLRTVSIEGSLQVILFSRCWKICLILCYSETP